MQHSQPGGVAPPFTWVASLYEGAHVQYGTFATIPGHLRGSEDSGLSESE